MFVYWRLMDLKNFVVLLCVNYVVMVEVPSKLFVVELLMVNGDGRVTKMLHWLFLKGVLAMEIINGGLWKAKYQTSCR
jgi:hypothetical protein